MARYPLVFKNCQESVYGASGAIYSDIKLYLMQLVSQATIQSNSRAAGLLRQAILKIPTFNLNSWYSWKWISTKARLKQQVKYCDL